MADVFISFVHEDQRVAEAVLRFLSGNVKPEGGIFLSSDQRQVYAGEIWLDRIKEELTAARVVVLMLSRRSVVHPWVNFEAGAAWLSDKAILPVCYGKLSKDALPRPYCGIQSLNLLDEKYYLLQSVAKHLGLPPPPGILARIGLSLQTGAKPSPLMDSLERMASIETALESFQDED